jgi:hypothetical protein
MPVMLSGVEAFFQVVQSCSRAFMPVMLSGVEAFFLVFWSAGLLVFWS